MGKRREGREAAVQFLYQLDMHGSGGAPVDAAAFWTLRSSPDAPAPPEKTRAFAEELVAGVQAHAEEIDAIRKFTANYELHRIAAVDRNVLRLAIYEMLHCQDIAPVIAINEAIEIAKRFGTEKSGAFVNGILDRIKAELKRPARTAAGSDR